MTFDRLVEIFLAKSKKSGSPYIVKKKDGTYYYKDSAHKILHRLDGPAIEAYNDTKSWYVDGKRHRDEKDINGLSLPAIEECDGTKHWWVDGKRHRDEKDINGLSLPAIEWSDDSKYWFVDGKQHRLDGPAIEWSDGTEEYWINGKELTKKEFEEHLASLDASKKVSETGEKRIPVGVLDDWFKNK